MAPEQVQGAPADARTDIFALGTIRYEMATGRRAFEAKTQAGLIAEILETDVPLGSTMTPVAPPMFDHVVQGCLAKEPADRWQTAHDVKPELQWIQSDGLGGPTASLDARLARAVWWPWAFSAACVAVLVLALRLLLWPGDPVAPVHPVSFKLIPSPKMQLDDADRGGDLA